MIRFLKVTGESLSPFLLDGDYVITLRLPNPLVKLKRGDWVVFRHPVHGVMIKKLEQLLQGGEELFVIGFHTESTDSRVFGPIPKRWATGKVIARIKKPRKV